MEAIEPKEIPDEPSYESPAPQKDEPTTSTASSEQPTTTTSSSEQGAEEPEKVEPTPQDEGEKVSFTITFKKQIFNVEFGMDKTIGDLRQEVAR
jgi:hypothetical protein